jgi:membrane protein required for colicin V production
MVGPLTYLDVVLLAICFISGILAMYRGLSREILSILSWIVAAGAAGYVWLFHKKLAEDVAQQISGGQQIVSNQVMIVQIAICALVFVIVLLVVHLFTSRISDAILESRVGMFDRLGGFLFGVVRGFVIVLVLFLGYDKFFPEEQQHYIVTKAKFRPLLLGAGKSLEPPLEYLYNRYLNKENRDARPG